MMGAVSVVCGGYTRTVMTMRSRPGCRGPPALPLHVLGRPPLRPSRPEQPQLQQCHRYHHRPLVAEGLQQVGVPSERGSALASFLARVLSTGTSCLRFLPVGWRAVSVHWRVRLSYCICPSGLSRTLGSAAPSPSMPTLAADVCC